MSIGNSVFMTSNANEKRWRRFESAYARVAKFLARRASSRVEQRERETLKKAHKREEFSCKAQGLTEFRSRQFGMCEWPQKRQNGGKENEQII